jgi:hypothetical protein
LVLNQNIYNKEGRCGGASSVTATLFLQLDGVLEVYLPALVEVARLKQFAGKQSAVLLVGVEIANKAVLQLLARGRA